MADGKRGDTRRKGTRAVLGRDPFSSLTNPAPSAPPAEPEPPAKPARKGKPERAAKPRTTKRPPAETKAKRRARPEARPAPGPDPFERLERRLEKALREEIVPSPPSDTNAGADAVAPLVEAVGRALEGVENLGDRVGVLERRIDAFLAEAEERLEMLSADGDLSPAARDEVRTLGGWVRTLKELRSALDGAKLRRAWQTRGSRARVTGALVLEELRQALRRGR